MGTGGNVGCVSCFGCGAVGGVGVEWTWTSVLREGWCYACVSCNSRLSVYVAGPCICILYLADTCAS